MGSSHLRLLREVDGAGPADYIWSGEDGCLHSKVRTVGVTTSEAGEAVPILERWNATLDDGTQIVLSPCHYLPNPLRKQPAFIALCEVRDLNDKAPPYNHRSRLRGAMVNPHFWWGVRQEYRLTPERRKAASLVAKRHLSTCFEAGLMLHSGRYSEAPWEFKLGPRRLSERFESEMPTATVIGDHLQIARFLLDQLAREHGFEGVDYSGSLCSVFFSTPDTRGLRINVDAVAEEVRRRLNLPEFLVKSRIGVAERGYTTLEICGFPASIDPYLLLGQVIHPIYQGRRLTQQMLDDSAEPPQNPDDMDP
jgi:hypothetical protein